MRQPTTPFEIDLSEWPAPFRDVVKSHGAEAVYQTGLRVLGYPPTWSIRGSEIVAVVKALTQPQTGESNDA